MNILLDLIWPTILTTSQKGEKFEIVEFFH